MSSQEHTMSGGAKPSLFLSYGRKDASEFADRLCVDLAAAGYRVWRDTRNVTAGASWQHEIAEGLRRAQIVIALMSPHAVRTNSEPNHPDCGDSICLGEIAFALFNPPTRPVVPVMALPCEPPIAIFHLDYVEMTRWRDSDEQYRNGMARLIDAIEAARRGEKRYRKWYTHLQPWDFASFFHDKRNDFIGRQWVFEAIDSWCAAKSGQRAMLITGDPGTGKSALVAELVHRNPRGQVIAWHCCQSDTPATLEPWRFVRSIAAMIASRLPEFAAALDTPSAWDFLSEEGCRHDPADALEAAVLAPLATIPAPAEGTRYLLIDALDEALASDTGLTIVDLLATRMPRLPEWLRVLATTRKRAEVLNRLRGLHVLELDARNPRNILDVEAYIRRRIPALNLAASAADASTAPESVVSTLTTKSEGNFLYVRQAIDGLESGAWSPKSLEEFPPGLYGLYDTFFRRQFGRQGEDYAAARPVLEAAVAAQEPLTLDQLAAATQLDSRRQLLEALIRLAPFLPRRTNADAVATYSMFHKSLADWLTADDLAGTSFALLPEDGHERLASWCSSEYEQGVQSMSSYALRYFARHLIGCGAWNELEKVMTDIKLLEARCVSGQIFDVADDFRDAVTRLPAIRPKRRILQLLEEALRREIHFIHLHRENYPQGLFQILWNTCWWYD